MRTFASLLLSIYESKFALTARFLCHEAHLSLSIYLSLTLTPLSVICPASPLDFVSFKLDVDHPETELPIALGLLNDPRLSSIVDEFFFEFHFRYLWLIARAFLSSCVIILRILRSTLRHMCVLCFYPLIFHSLLLTLSLLLRC